MAAPEAFRVARKLRFSLRDLFKFGEVTLNVGRDANGRSLHHWKDTRTREAILKFENEYVKARNARIKKHFVTYGESMESMLTFQQAERVRLEASLHKYKKVTFIIA